MNRSELIKKLSAQQSKLSKDDVALGFNAIINIISSSLKNNGRIEFRGFGSFRMCYRKSYEAFNPRSREKLKIAERYIPHFKPSLKLRNRVNRKS